MAGADKVAFHDDRLLGRARPRRRARSTRRRVLERRGGRAARAGGGGRASSASRATGRRATRSWCWRSPSARPRARPRACRDTLDTLARRDARSAIVDRDAPWRRSPRRGRRGRAPRAPSSTPSPPRCLAAAEARPRGARERWARFDVRFGILERPDIDPRRRAPPRRPPPRQQPAPAPARRPRAPCASAARRGRSRPARGGGARPVDVGVEAERPGPSASPSRPSARVRVDGQVHDHQDPPRRGVEQRCPAALSAPASFDPNSRSGQRQRDARHPRPPAPGAGELAAHGLGAAPVGAPRPARSGPRARELRPRALRVQQRERGPHGLRGGSVPELARRRGRASASRAREYPSALICASSAAAST